MHFHEILIKCYLNYLTLLVRVVGLPTFQFDVICSNPQEVRALTKIVKFSLSFKCSKMAAILCAESPCISIILCICVYLILSV